MRKNRFTEAQIIGTVEEQEADIPNMTIIAGTKLYLRLFK